MPKKERALNISGFTSTSKLIESDELLSLIIAVAVTTIIFAYNWQAPLATIDAIPSSFLAVVTAFLFHELAHRFAAKRLHCSAVYRIWIPGIIFGLLMMLIGIKLILVGAVVISTYKFGRWGMKSRYPSMREIGLISVSGPLTNLILASAFRIISESTLIGTSLGATFAYLASINLWIAFFNLVPVKPLDGSKIFFWNPRIWFFLILFSLFLLIPSHVFGLLSTSLG